MAKRGKSKVKRGRPKRAVKAVVIRLVLTLDPAKDADLITQFSQVEERGKAALAIRLMRSGLLKPEPVALAENIVDLDDSEF